MKINNGVQGTCDIVKHHHTTIDAGGIFWNYSRRFDDDTQTINPCGSCQQGVVVAAHQTVGHVTFGTRVPIRNGMHDHAPRHQVICVFE